MTVIRAAHRGDWTVGQQTGVTAHYPQTMSKAVLAADELAATPEVLAGYTAFPSWKR